MPAPTEEAVCEQLSAEFARLISGVEGLLGPYGIELVMPIRSRLESTAQTFTLQLLGGDDHEAAGTATDVVTALFPGDTEIPEAWWRTPLGRTVAATSGHPSAEYVTFSVAGAMLGVSKQRVSKLTEEGKLDRHPDGGVTALSVQQRLRSLYWS